jgi:hypothetical protein
MSNRRRFYITTAIPYVNGDPHLGHALEFVQADVLARHRRQRGDAVRFLSGTDDNALQERGCCRGRWSAGGGVRRAEGGSVTPKSPLRQAARPSRTISAGLLVTSPAYAPASRPPGSRVG